MRAQDILRGLKPFRSKRKPKLHGVQELLDRQYQQYQLPFSRTSDRWWDVSLLTRLRAIPIRLKFTNWQSKTRPSNASLRRAPGWHLRIFAEFLFSAKTYGQIFEPTLRDLFDEYCEALAAHRLWKARWVRIRGYWSFWATVLAQTPISVVKKIYQIWRAIP